MSVTLDLKQPSPFQHPEFQCGELKSPSAVGVLPGTVTGHAGVSTTGVDVAHISSGNLACKDDHKCQGDSNHKQGNFTLQPQASAFRRRRFASCSHQKGAYSTERPQQVKKRRHSSKAEKEKIVLPTKFLLGGNINDPLNLNSLSTDGTNQDTPVSSPVPTPAHRRQVNVIIPPNITDPLNLNCDDEELEQLSSPKFQRKKKRCKHKKKEASLSGENQPQNTEQDISKPLSIQVDPEIEKGVDDIKKSDPKISPQVKAQDQIVSPVIPQTSPKSRRRKRNSSECKSDSGYTAARSILKDDADKAGPSTSPSRTKYRRQHSGGQKHDTHPLKQPNQKPFKGSHNKFIYGNYSRYYGYRNPNLDEDSRLKCFEREWFEGKNVLDIGCNVGHITLAIARYFDPLKITGIDIDGKLIGAARKNIKYYLPGEDGSDSASSKFPFSMKSCYGPISKQPLHDIQSSEFVQKIVNFRQVNYVLESDALLDIQKEEYDCILALSLTKWIHLNWGDDGLKRTFKRIFRQLNPGGLFILEPQPWASYKKKKKLTDAIFENFQNIKLKPENFREYLLSPEVGFATCRFVDIPFNKSQGFRRSITVFTKPNIPSVACTLPVNVAHEATSVNIIKPVDGTSQNTQKMAAPQDTKLGVDSIVANQMAAHSTKDSESEANVSMEVAPSERRDDTTAEEKSKD